MSLIQNDKWHKLCHKINEYDIFSLHFIAFQKFAGMVILLMLSKRVEWDHFYISSQPQNKYAAAVAVVDANETAAITSAAGKPNSR